MTRENSTEAIFAQALELGSPEARQRYLDDVCAGDLALRQEMQSLLDAHEAPANFIPSDGPGGKEVPNTPPGFTEHTVRISTGAVRLRATERKAPPEPPKIPGFRIERALGSGGLGIVYEAWDEKLHRKVALKTLHGVTDVHARLRILDEARKTAALADPAIVTVHAVLDEQEPPAIVMELVEGFPLDQFAASLTFEQKAHLLHEIVRALTAAHRAGVIHRDLKPANILVTPAMRPMILDFGLALSVREAGMPTGGFAGSPLYASPEQAEGKPLTPASDVFSFGSLMFHLLTGRTPFTGATLGEVLHAVRRTAPPFLRDVAVGVPEDLQAICLACLTAAPELRPAADEVMVDLGRFLAGEPARLRPALYGDILRRRISEYSNDLVNWEHQGIISSDERDRLEVVHRRILADEDHWLIDARRLTLPQTVLYTSTWIVVVAAGLLVWMVRSDLSPPLRWIFPLSGTMALIAVGVLAQGRGDAMAAASFLAGAVLSLVPTTLAILGEFHWFALPQPGVEQLFQQGVTNQQVLAASGVALASSLFALRHLRMTGFAWTTCFLAAAAFFSLLLQFNWLHQTVETRALWLLPLTGFAGIALAFERVGRIRWALPFHIIALLILVGGLDVMANAGPTLAMLGLTEARSAFLNHHRQEFFSYALNGIFFLALMFATEGSRSLDLRRGSRVLEVLAIVHLLGGLYLNAQQQRHDPKIIVDVCCYLAAVLLFLVLGPWRSRWRMLMGALSGVALGSFLLVDLNLVSRKPFVLGMGGVGLVVALGSYLYLMSAVRPERGAKPPPKPLVK